MQVTKVNEYELNLNRPEEKGELRCIYYKDRTCEPKEIQFKACLNCHKCKAIAPENLVPKFFDRIVGLAGFLMGLMGMGGGQAAGSGAGRAGGGSGGAGGGGGGGK